MSETTFPDFMAWIGDHLSENELKALRESMGKPMDLSIRLNTLKANPAQMKRQLQDIYKMQLEEVPFCASGFWIRENGGKASRSIEHRMGYFYIQEAASMLPPELFDFSIIDRPLILDMAASPGGKTTHLASLSGDRGLIIANDASRSRIKALQIVLADWGVVNHAITCLPGEYFGERLPETFDMVLLDAPCSMQGLRSTDSHKNRPITMKEISQLASRQTRLLESALRTAKVGGQVVYSTCTLTLEENELVLEKMLDKYEGLVEIVDVSGKLPAPAKGVTSADRNKQPININRSLRIWPHLFGTAGFFAAKLIKTGNMPRHSLVPKRDNAPRHNFKSLDEKYKIELSKILMDQYGIDLRDILKSFSVNIHSERDLITLLPRTLLRDFTMVPWLSAGIPIGKYIKNVWHPSHEFTSRYGNLFKNGILQLESEHIPTWLRGGDVRGYQSKSADTGSVVLIKDETGRNLGLGKLLHDRLRNLLPTRLF